MPLDPRVQKLLDHVYGPWPDERLLEEDYGNPNHALYLKDLRIFQGGRLTGFDETEKSERSEKDTKDGPVTCDGAIDLDVESLSWLTEKGYEMLEKAVYKYDEKVNQRLPVFEPGDEVLRKLFRISRNAKLKVRISFHKLMKARFLSPSTEKRDPHDSMNNLLLISRHGKRTYKVRTYNEDCYALSRNFDERHRLRALVSQLIETDPDKTPQKRRDIDWVLDRLERMIEENPGFRRPPDMIPEMDPELAEEIPADEPRKSRPLSREELESGFARQAEWFLAHHLYGRPTQNDRKKLFDIPSLIAYCEEVNRRGERRPRPYYFDKGPTGTLAQRMTQVHGVTTEYWENKLKKYVDERKGARSAASKKSRRPRSGSPAEDEYVEVIHQVNHTHDSDFTDNEDTSDEETSDSPDPDQDYRDITVPVSFLYAPEIISGRTTWDCSECPYSFDLLNLTNAEISPDVLPPTLRKNLQAKRWDICDPPVQKAFKLIVTNHQKAHLDLLRQQQTLEERVRPERERLMNRKDRARFGDVKVEDDT